MNPEFLEKIKSADILIRNNNFKSAAEVYEDALNFASTPEEKILNHSLLGKIYQRTRNSTKSIEYFQKTLDLLEENPSDQNEVQKAIMHNNLGVLFYDRDLKKSVEQYLSAIEIFKDLKEQDNDSNSTYLANTHFALAFTYLKNNQLQEAKNSFKETLKAFPIMATEDHQYLISSCYFELGNIYSEELNHHDAKTNYLKSEKIFRLLSERQEEAFLPYLTSTLNNLGVTYKSMEEFENSIKYYKEAIQNYTLLAQKYNSEFLPYLAATQNSLSIVLGETKNYDAAIDFGKKALDIYSGLYQEYPEDFAHYLATALHNLGVYHLEKNDLKDAEEYFGKSLTLRNGLAKEQPESFNADVCATVLNLIEIHHFKFGQTMDEEYKENCQKLLKELNPKLNTLDPELPVVKSMKSDYEYYMDFFDTYREEDLLFEIKTRENDGLSEKIFDTSDSGKKIELQKQINANIEELYGFYPNSEKIKNELAYVKNDLAWLYLSAKKFKKSEEILLNAIELDQPILNLKCNLAHSYLFQNLFEKAKTTYLEIANQKNKSQKFYKDVILEDFQKLNQEGIDHPDIMKIVALLKEHN